jgi:hypothetical protein
MKTFEQLVELWAAAPRAPAGQGTVRGIYLRLCGAGMSGRSAPSSRPNRVSSGIVGASRTIPSGSAT